MKIKIIPLYQNTLSNKRLNYLVLGDSLESIELQTEASSTPAMVPPATKAANGERQVLIESEAGRG